jgi:hypothetical protein
MARIVAKLTFCPVPLPNHVQRVAAGRQQPRRILIRPPELPFSNPTVAEPEPHALK